MPLCEHPFGAGQHACVPSLRVGLDEADVCKIDLHSIHPGVQSQTWDNDPLVFTDMLRARDEMVRAASPHAHRHLTLDVANGDSIWKHEASHPVADDVPHETGVVERIRLDRVDPIEVAKQSARN